MRTRSRSLRSHTRSFNFFASAIEQATTYEQIMPFFQHIAYWWHDADLVGQPHKEFLLSSIGTHNLLRNPETFAAGKCFLRKFLFLHTPQDFVKMTDDIRDQIIVESKPCIDYAELCFDYVDDLLAKSRKIVLRSVDSICYTLTEFRHLFLIAWPSCDLLRTSLNIRAAFMRTIHRYKLSVLTQLDYLEKINHFYRQLSKCASIPEIEEVCRQPIDIITDIPKINLVVADVQQDTFRIDSSLFDLNLLYVSA